MSAPLSVLIVEDEAKIRRFLRTSLETRGYRILEAETAESGLALAASHLPDLVLLDLGLPDKDGIEVVKDLREWSAVPIVVLSARGQEQSKVQALDAGADDYVTKPFGVEELHARMRAAARRHVQSQSGVVEPVFSVGDLSVDLVRRRVTVKGEEVRLTPHEYSLLAVLVRNQGKVVTHRQLLTEVWGAAFSEETHYLRVFMRQLRSKLEPEPPRPRYLLTETGVGYRMVDE